MRFGSIFILIRKHYVNLVRREEGFDQSGSHSPEGEFHFGRGLGVGASTNVIRALL